MAKFIAAIVLFCFLIKTSSAQINPLTGDTIRNRYKEISLHFTYGKAQPDSFKSDDFMYTADHLYLSLYNIPRYNKTNTLRFDKTGKLIYMDSGLNTSISYLYEGDVLVEKEIHLGESTIIVKFVYNRNGQLITVSKYGVVAVGKPNSKYILNTRDSLFYQDKKLVSRTNLWYGGGDSTNVIRTVRDDFDYYPSGEVKEERTYYDKRTEAAEIVKYEKNGDFTRYNYSEAKVNQFTQLYFYSKGKIRLRYTRNPDSTLISTHRFDYDKLGHLLEFNMQHAYRFIRQIHFYDQLNRETGREIIKNGRLLYKRKTSYNKDGDVLTSAYYTADNRLILGYTVSYLKF